MELSPFLLYSITAILLFGVGLHGLFFYAHFLRKVMAMNVIGTGVFLFLIASAERAPEGTPDPVPHGMVLTGIVVAISATAFALSMIGYLYMKTGSTDLNALLSEEDQKE